MSVNRKVQYIGVPFGWGAKEPGTQDGPESILNVLPQSLKEKALLLPKYECSKVHPSYEEAFPFVEKINVELAYHVHSSLQKGDFPLIVGGDHSIAIGSWSGVKKYFGDFGLIWIDAHMDAHTFETSPSKSFHGMPLAVLLGFGDEKLTRLGGSAPKIKPENLFLIGIRHFEKDEENLLKKLGVRIYYMEEIRQRSSRDVFLESVFNLQRRNLSIGVSLDIDAFDEECAPGTGTPEKNGFNEEEISAFLKHVKGSLCALEIIEFNPSFDHNYKTRDLMTRLIHICL
ncbi:MAG: arginase [Proteobacteria bacterium]|nr:arginase [Pseudomonadota bacterium]